MRLSRLLVAALLVAAAVALAKAAVTRDGVGAFEYVTVVALIALLLKYAYVAGRSGLRRSSSP